MSGDYHEYAPRCVEIAQELIRTGDVEAWIGAFAALCAEAASGQLDRIDEAVECFGLEAVLAMTSEERLCFMQLLSSAPDFPERVQAAIRRIVGRKGMSS